MSFLATRLGTLPELRLACARPTSAQRRKHGRFTDRPKIAYSGVELPSSNSK
jgi:hypothetical protein